MSRLRSPLHISPALDDAGGVDPPRNILDIPSSARLAIAADCSPIYATDFGDGTLVDCRRFFLVVLHWTGVAINWHAAHQGCWNDTFRFPAFSNLLLQFHLAFSYPWRIVFFSDFDRRMTEQHGDCFDVYSSNFFITSLYLLNVVQWGFLPASS